MGTACFVILHYNTIEDTRRCVASVKGLDGQEDIRIVIVDNASCNKTGQLLSDAYADDANITVILRTLNGGFSAGNNEGCQYAIERWQPDFLVVANNDIVFGQKDFVTLLKNEYAKKPYAVLGPDIYVPHKEIHQSPLSADIPTKRQVNRTIFLNRLMLLLYPLVYPAMRKYYAALSGAATLEQYDTDQENVCLMGACLVFTKDYYSRRDKIFLPETKFYYEENIMTLWCRCNHQRVIYRPRLRVQHMEGKATQTIDVSLRERIRFRMENIVSSAKIYQKFLREMTNGK